MTGSWTRRALPSALLVVATACAGGPGPPGPEPAPAPSPPVTPEPPRLEERTDPLPDAPPVELDPILDSRWAWGEDLRPDVDFWLDLFTGRGSASFRLWLERMGGWEWLVDAEIRARDLPASLRYLPIIESGYNPSVESRARAVGMWQFMAPTARYFGMEVNGLLDERRDPLVATPGALDYLSELRVRFGSWFLALAAYNGGPGRVSRLLRTRAPGVEGSDSLFLVIRDGLPRETRLFVPKLLAAARIARAPERYGFQGLAAHPPVEFDEVLVPDATSVDVLAEAAGVSQEVIEGLNPQLLRGLTPAGRTVRLRVPPGRGSEFEARYARIPPEERVTFLEHEIRPGETLSHVARRYRVDLSALRDANPGVEPRRLRVGQRLIVPRAPRTTSGPTPVVAYTVQPGDTLSGIASRHGVSAGDLARENGLSLGAVIRPGDRVRIPTPGR